MISYRHFFGGSTLREENKEALNLLLKRSLISIPFIGLGVYFFIPYRLWSFLALVPFTIVGALLVGPLSSLFCQPFGSVFNPRGNRRRPHLAFSLPEARVMDGRYEEALKLYREMLEVDPQRLEVYMRMLDLAFTNMKQPDVAREAFNRGMAAIGELRERETLSREYCRLRELFRESGSGN